MCIGVIRNTYEIFVTSPRGEGSHKTLKA